MGEQLGGTALESTVVNVSAISIIKGLWVYKSLVFISRVILLGKSWRMLEGYDRLSMLLCVSVTILAAIKSILLLSIIPGLYFRRGNTV